MVRIFICICVCLSIQLTQASEHPQSDRILQQEAVDLVEGLLSDMPAGTIYRLSPNPQSGLPPGKHLHDYPILGQWSLATTKERQLIYQLILESIRQSDGQMARCFIPHHGLQIESKGGPIDLVICFQCFTVKMYQGNACKTFGITRKAEPEINQFLKSHGITTPLP